jgi:DNA-binding beta-propeller fold protein YncE
MEMYEANDMVVSSDETYLYVADTFYDRVLVYNIASITDGEAPVNVIGQQTLSDYGYGTSDTELFGPSGVWLGNGTSLYVSDSDNNRVMSFSISPLTDGISAEDAVGQLTPTDQPIFTVNGENDSPNALGYKQPAGVAVDTAGHRLFVADTVNNRVLMYNLTTHNQFDDHVADAVLGQPDFKARTAATTADGMSAPKQLAYDTARNRLFVADSGNNRVLAFDVASITDGESATMVFGQGADVASAPNFTTATTAPVSAHSLNAPSGVAVDSTNGALFISDTLNNRVLAYDFNAGNGSFANGDADRVFGQSGNFSLNASASDANGFYQPSGVFVDAAGDAFWVADTLNNRVLKRPLAADSVDPATVVLGQADFTTATAGTTERKMSEPTAVAKDDNTGDLYVADTENNRVLSFTTTDGVDSGEAATAVYGQASFGTAAPDVTAETVSGPRAIAYDPTRGTLWAADAANNRVLYFGPLDEVLVTGPGGGTEPIGFYPLRIVINDDDTTTDSRNVLVNVFAQYNANFSGTVDVLLSNTPDFATTIPFRYTIPRRTVFTAWNKTMAWDLCFGLPSTTPCDPGKKIVYARFYVNLPTVWPILTPFTTARTTP